MLYNVTVIINGAFCSYGEDMDALRQVYSFFRKDDYPLRERRFTDIDPNDGCAFVQEYHDVTDVELKAFVIYLRNLSNDELTKHIYIKKEPYFTVDELFDDLERRV